MKVPTEDRGDFYLPNLFSSGLYRRCENLTRSAHKVRSQTQAYAFTAGMEFHQSPKKCKFCF